MGDEPVYVESSAKCGPAGDETRAARYINVLRWSLAAKIKQGVPMSELVEAFIKLSILEGLHQ